jgi:hypothetical protein
MRPPLLLHFVVLDTFTSDFPQNLAKEAPALFSPSLLVHARLTVHGTVYEYQCCHQQRLVQ